jgi:hypothetical protein
MASKRRNKTMGVSTDGILFYGFYEAEESEWAEYDEGDEAYLEEHGQSRIDGLFEQKFKKTNLYLGSHCSDNYRLRFLAIASTHIEASRGYPQKVDPTSMIVQPEWEPLLRNCAEELGIDLGDKKPDWYLASYWG